MMICLEETMSDGSSEQKDYADMVEMSVRDNRSHEVTFFEGEIGEGETNRQDQTSR
jgi:hypothetical protein